MGITSLRHMIRKVSSNDTIACYALKMDIRRFFDTVDHQILKILIKKEIHDENILKIIDTIIDSFKIKNGALGNIGLPLGNVTSQLFANIYLHVLDDFVKQKLREKYYLRYCDDFIILSSDKNHLHSLIEPIANHLKIQLGLELHPQKVSIRKLSQGIDFVGYNLFSKSLLVRTKTKQRMKKRLKEAFESYLNGKITAIAFDQKLHSYLGVLSHANQHTLSQALKNAYWVR